MSLYNMKTQTDFLKLSLSLNCLSFYHGVLEHRPLRCAADLVAALTHAQADIRTQTAAYITFYRALLEDSRLSWSETIIYAVLRDVNPFSAGAAAHTRNPARHPGSHRACTQASPNDWLRRLAPAVIEDLNTLQTLAFLHPGDIKELLRREAILSSQEWALSTIAKLPEWPLTPMAVTAPTRKRRRAHSPQAVCDLFIDALSSEGGWAGLFNELIDFYRTNGCGEMPFAGSFHWNGSELLPIVRPDPVTFADLVDYDGVIARAADNVRAFLAGKPAENALLYGARGTGKSSTVKALINEFFVKGLRLVEVQKQHLSTLPQLMDQLHDSRLRYIIFIDDLSFNQQGDEYNALKSVLEGGIYKQPANLLFYVTSNRRHLVVERFSDTQEDLFENDARHEKLSLAERFGLALHYRTPLQSTYLDIVFDMADQIQSDIPHDVLEKEALTYANRMGNRSPRTARQFIRTLISEQ